MRAKGGNTIPMVFVTTADGRKGIDAIPYTALKNDMRKSVRTLRTTLENVDVLNGGAEADSKTTEDDHPTTPAADQPEFTEWKNTAGRAIEAAALDRAGVLASGHALASLGDIWENDHAEIQARGGVTFLIDRHRRGDGAPTRRAATAEELYPAIRDWADALSM